MLAVSVVDKARTVMLPLLAFTVEHAKVLIGLLVARANWLVSLRTGHTVVLKRALSITFKGHSFAFTNAFIVIGDTINSAFRGVARRAIIAVGVLKVAKSIVMLPDSLTV
jgi:hypothetical protein